MRGIKFKIFDVQTNKIYPNYYELIKEIHFDEYGNIDEIIIARYNSDGNWEFEKINDFELMQYTGLKDKNGKEIYEGDVIRFTYWLFDGNYIDEELIGIIKYKPERMSFVLADIKPTHRYFGNEIEFACITFDAADFEVIGNIFENKELLEL